MLRALLIVVLLGAFICAQGQYEGHMVMHVSRATNEQVEQVRDAGLDIWAFLPSDSPAHVAFDVMVDGESRAVLDQAGLTYTVKIEDVQANVEAEEKEIMAALHKNTTSDIFAAPDDWYVAYHTYPEIVTHLQELVKTYPDLVTYVPSIGKSIQNRDIPGIVIHSKASTVNRYFYLLGGQHAREWVGPATTLYVAEQLLVQYAAGNQEVRTLLSRAAFHVLPMVNPDGYTHSWPVASGGGGTRLWRKNRRQNAGGSFGVDLNRNWDDGHWGMNGGSSNNPTAEDYRGTAAFSEPEGKAVAEYVLRQPFKFSGMIDYHSYSQLVMRPPGWTSSPTVNETVLSTVGTGVRNAILRINNVSYTSQRSFQLYATTGTSDDWGYYKAGIVFSFCIELRDTGTFGFQLPASQILPTGRENFAGLLYFANYIVAISSKN